MKINFENIHISNFLSIGDTTIDLDSNGYTLVNGVNLNPDDMAKSNGSGKSSIWEAISWVLTGETIRGSKDITNIHGTDGALVELNFKINSDSYKIIRTKDHSKYKTNLKIFINGEDKSGKGIADSKKLLAEYLPDLTSSLLGSVIILGQGLPQRFTNNSPSGRKEVLEKLSKSDFMLQDLKDRIANRKNILSTNLRTCEDDILRLTSTKTLLDSQIRENKIKLDSLSSTEKLDELINELNSAVLDCQIKINTYNEQYEQARVKYQELSSQKNELNEELVKFANEKSIVQQKKIDLDTLIRSESDKINTEYDIIARKFLNDHLAANSELKSKKAELEKMRNIKDTCPTCGQKLPGVFKPDTTEIERAIDSLTDSVNDAQQAYNNTLSERDSKVEENKLKYTADYDNFKSETEKIIEKENAVKQLINNVSNELNTLGLELNKIKESITIFTNKCENYKTRVESAKIEKESLDSKRIAAQNIIDTNTNQIAELTSEVNNKEAEKLTINTHLDIINKMNTVITRDFRGYLLTNIIDFIDRKSKEYSLEVFETDKIEFKLDGNNISIRYDNKDYENLSGGEKQKVDLIIQFAIRDMLCKYLDFSSNILVLDEICDNVDSVGAEKLFNMISRKLSDVQSIFIVSHHSDFQIPVDRQLTVTKGIDKISKVSITI